jgi:long-chain acyl-CoA synthetase
LVADLGAGGYSVANVALYDTLGPETTEFIINHSELPVIVASIDKIDILLNLSSKCPNLKVIIVIESLLKEQNTSLEILKKWGAQLGIKVVTFQDTIRLGQKNPRELRLPKPEDLFCISYTSGLLYVNVRNYRKS